MEEQKSISDVLKKLEDEKNQVEDLYEDLDDYDSRTRGADVRRILDLQGETTYSSNEYEPRESHGHNPQVESQPPPVRLEASQDALPEINDVKNDIAAIQEGMEGLVRDVKTIADSAEKSAGEVREMHKLYHNEFANRLKSMQTELEEYREIEKGRVFDGLLSEIAKIYSENESIIEEIEEEKVKKRIRYMFMDIMQILEANGVIKLKSSKGDKRNTKHCQVVERIVTDAPSLHDTIAQSRSSGFYVDNRSLVKEMVDVYLFDNRKADISAEK